MSKIGLLIKMKTAKLSFPFYFLGNSFLFGEHLENKEKLFFNSTTFASV